MINFSELDYQIELYTRQVDVVANGAKDELTVNAMVSFVNA